MKNTQTEEICYKITVPKEQGNFRLDQFLGEQGLFKNRSQALKAIKQNKVLLKEKPLKPSFQLKGGDVLTIYLPAKLPEENLTSYDFPVPCLHEDEDILVVNKPAGLVTHPAPGHKSDTLINALFQKKNLSPGSHPLRPGLVHRLDKDTSGLLVLAKNKFSEENLIGQFKTRTIERIYWGITLKPFHQSKGKIESYLTRHPKNRKRFISLPAASASDGKKAITNYRILKQHDSGLTWMEYSLETGRTHQIRVHSVFLNCPLVGDNIYGRAKWKNLHSKKLQNLCKTLNRVALHAHTLRFHHPRTGKPLSFTSPWPNDLLPLLKHLNFM
ncbi:MAG: RluA family pseudouridine synthase [Bdellovibrionales bacterium]|nr:RluA family pseudouridine synthase [Bdellovibrionales bacterium]